MWPNIAHIKTAESYAIKPSSHMAQTAQARPSNPYVFQKCLSQIPLKATPMPQLARFVYLNSEQKGRDGNKQQIKTTQNLWLSPP